MKHFVTRVFTLVLRPRWRLALVLVTGCSAASSALGALSSKPPQATVVNNVVVQPAPAPEKPTSSATGAVVTGGIAGALAGGATAVALHGGQTGIVSGVLAGAGAGVALGYAVHAAAE